MKGTPSLERIGIDLTNMVAGVQRHRYGLIIIDHYSWYVRFYQLKTKHTTHVTQADFGAPGGIVLGNGEEITSREFHQFFNQKQILLYYTTPYHPQGNGITECMHKTLKSVLAALCQGHPLIFPNHLQCVPVCLNTSVYEPDPFLRVP